MKQTEDVFCEDGALVKIPSPVPPSEAMRLSYECKYLPTGNTYPLTALFRNRHAFIRCLERWNRQGAGMWEYRALDEEMSHG